MAKKKTTRKRKPAAKKVGVRHSKAVRGKRIRAVSRLRRRLGARSGSQSGDAQSLSNAAGADSESVAELVAEGQSFEAGVVGGVEAADSSQGEVRTKQVREDDVPLEYLDKD